MQNTRPTELAVNQVNQVDEVKRLFKQAATFLRLIGEGATMDNNLTNRNNLKLVKTLKKYVDQLGVEYPLQAKVIHLFYFELKTFEEVASRVNYSEREIYRQKKEAMELIAGRFFNAQPGATSRSAEL